MQQWADNTVLISESFDQITAGKLVDAVRQGKAEVQADNVRSGRTQFASARSAGVFRISGSGWRHNIA